MEKGNKNLGQTTARNSSRFVTSCVKKYKTDYILIHYNLLYDFNSTVLVGCKVNVGIPHTAHFSTAPPLHEQGCRLR